MSRLALVFVGAAIVLIAAAFFHRFDPAKSERGLLGNIWTNLKQAVIAFITTPSKSPNPTDSDLVAVMNETVAHLGSLPDGACLRISQLRSYWQVMIAELRLIFKGVHWLWYVGA